MRKFIVSFLLFLCIGVVFKYSQPARQDMPAEPVAAAENAAGLSITEKPDNNLSQNITYDIILLDTAENQTRTFELDEYLLGVVASEMPAEYNIEALKAQAIAARTFAARQLFSVNRKHIGYHLCSYHGCCQAWRSPSALEKLWGDKYYDYYEKIRTAVTATAGIVLTYDGELIDALYHSTSGGKTEDVEAVFSQSLPYLRSVSSAGEESAAKYKNISIFSNYEFSEIINSYFPGANMQPSTLPEQFEILRLSDSRRALDVRLGDITVSGRELRSALALNSTMIDISFDGGSVIISQQGYGHGVGMSQVGANAMANAGASYEEILRHYYTDVELSNLNDISID